MIIIKVQGGLGNQLLQYSIGRVIETLYKKEVKYDISFFENNTKYTKRLYHLDKFTLLVSIATDEEVQRIRYPYGIFSKIFDKGRRALNKYIFKKYYISYDKNFLTMVSKKDSLYLEGFWQGYKYYSDCLEDLSSSIVLRDMGKVTTFKQQYNFSGKISISVHIRRGDFLNRNAGTKAVPSEYYERAIPLMEKKIEGVDCIYYVFSDDINWVKEFMGHLFKNVVYVSSLGFSDFEEFLIMKSCTHAVLSNSTFCWFSTLLTNYPSKIVIYPKDWKNIYLNNSDDVCPPEWFGL